MYGLDAISQHNGWAISVVGISIVFTGLVCLSIAINQLHKLLDLWDDREKFQLLMKNFISPSKKESPSQPISFDPGQKETGRQFNILADTLGQTFSLSRLLTLAEVSGLDRPHANLSRLFKAKIVVPDNDGYFLWDKDQFTKLIS